MRIEQLPAVIKERIPSAEYPATFLHARAVLKDGVKKLRALNEMEDVKELMDKSDLIAGYAKAIKSTELEHDVRVYKLECWNRIGELGLAIPPARPLYLKKPLHLGAVRENPNSRKAMFKRAGVSGMNSHLAMRLAALPPAEKEAIIQSGAGIDSLRIKLPVRANRLDRFIASPLYREVMKRLSQVNLVESFPAATTAAQMTEEEARHIRPRIVALLEWCDEFEQNLPKNRA